MDPLPCSLLFLSCNPRQAAQELIFFPRFAPPLKVEALKKENEQLKKELAIYKEKEAADKTKP